MKIAVSSAGKDPDSEIDVRFGRCPYFLIVDIEGKKIKGFKAIENTASAQAGGAGMTAAQIVADQNVEAVITANVGPRAFDVFGQLGITVYTAQGKIKDAVKDFIDGKLEEVRLPTGPQHMGIGGFRG
jgi:predicted Fe-Mo cluster-binding NifX family protein